jgi:hypothetical protein
MRCRQPGTLQISATLGAGQRGCGDQVAAMLLRLLNSMRYQCSMVAKAPGILSGGSRSKVCNAITAKYIEAPATTFPSAFRMQIFRRPLDVCSEKDA